VDEDEQEELPMSSVMLVDDHTVLREGLRRCFESAGLDVIADVGDADSALSTVERSRPNVVVIDVSLPGRDGIDVTRQLRREYPGTSVVVLTMFSDEATVKEAFGAGAAAYLTKDCSASEIVATVQEVAQGRYRGGELTCSYLKASSRAARSVPSHSLTARELEVLQMLANGASNYHIAKQLYISDKTVKNHLEHIYEKLDVQSRTQAVAKAVRLGLVRIT
jgi:DNA-binding NarL/FixJ family response regulator